MELPWLILGPDDRGRDHDVLGATPGLELSREEADRLRQFGLSVASAMQLARRTFEVFFPLTAAEGGRWALARSEYLGPGSLGERSVTRVLILGSDELAVLDWSAAHLLARFPGGAAEAKPTPLRVNADPAEAPRAPRDRFLSLLRVISEMRVFLATDGEPDLVVVQGLLDAAGRARRDLAWATTAFLVDNGGFRPDHQIQLIVAPREQIGRNRPEVRRLLAMNNGLVEGDLSPPANLAVWRGLAEGLADEAAWPELDSALPLKPGLNHLPDADPEEVAAGNARIALARLKAEDRPAAAERFARAASRVAPPLGAAAARAVFKAYETYAAADSAAQWVDHVSRALRPLLGEGISAAVADFAVTHGLLGDIGVDSLRWLLDDIEVRHPRAFRALPKSRLNDVGFSALVEDALARVQSHEASADHGAEVLRAALERGGGSATLPAVQALAGAVVKAATPPVATDLAHERVLSRLEKAGAELSQARIALAGRALWAARESAATRKQEAARLRYVTYVARETQDDEADEGLP